MNNSDVESDIVLLSQLLWSAPHSH